MRYIKAIFVYSILLLTFYAKSVLGDSYGFFVDGGYSPGNNDTEMDKMVDKRVDDAKKNMEDKDPNAKTKRFDDKKDLIKALEELNCKCGDELTLYMVGHGEIGEFKFTKKGQTLKAEELRKALTKAAIECCCKIHIVIFACHSGSFIDELFKEPHVISVYTSCKKDEVTHSDARREDGVFVDGGDWAEGFNQDYKNSQKKDEGDRIQEASETAKQKMPDKFAPTDHPQGWRRGEQEAYGHVVSRRKDEKGKKIMKLTVHFYSPEYLRCTTKEVKTGGVNVSDSINTCVWIKFTMVTDKPTDSIYMKNDPVISEPPVEKVLAHVEGREGKNVLKIHIISPKWLYCKKVKLKVDPPGKIDKSIQVCNWINVGVKITDPDNKDKGFSTTDDVKPHSQEFKCKVHIEKVSWQTGKMNIHILEPPWLNCQRHEVTAPEGEREKLRNVDKCSNVSMIITFDSTVRVRDIKLITDAEGVKKFSLDAALQKPKPPVIDSTRAYQPSIGVTNVGLNSITFPIYAVICKLSEFNLIENWWKTGQGEPSGVWYNVREVSSLPSAETRIVNFNNWQAPSGNEIYWIGFRTKLQGDQNPASDTASTVLIVSEITNHPPILQNADIEPDSGGIATTFTYRVTYSDEDNDAPSIYEVLIDNIPYNMIGTGNNYTEGVIFAYQTTLSLRQHTYKFKFNDGHGHEIISQTYSGPIVSGVTNSPPILQGGNVQPDSGYVYTQFIFRVTYIDADGDAPTIYQVFIDNNPVNMTPLGNNFTEGVVFICQRNLNPGMHTFFFRFDDGHGHMVNTENYSGPRVW